MSACASRSSTDDRPIKAGPAPGGGGRGCLDAINDLPPSHLQNARTRAHAGVLSSLNATRAEPLPAPEFL